MYLTILVLHLLGAAVWTGGHLVLALGVLPGALRARDPEPVRRFEAHFERIGIPALVVQVVTGLWLADRLLPQRELWFSLQSHYSEGIVMKLGLLLLTVVLALHARLRIIPKLTAHNMGILAVHIALVTASAVAFVLVGASFRVGGLF